MAALIRDFPCFSGFVILTLLGLAFLTIVAAENVALARIKARALVDVERAKANKPPRGGEAS